MLVCSVLSWFILKGGDASSRHIRMRANLHIRPLDPGAWPAPIFNRTDGERIWAVRREATSAIISPALAEAVQYLRDACNIPTAESVPQSSIPVHEQGGLPYFLASLAQGSTESLDVLGKPLRWGQAPDLFQPFNKRKTAGPPRFINSDDSNKGQFSRALSRMAPAGNAREYRALVESFAKRFSLSTELVMAIIHSESHFSPTLVSSKSAMGLMQLLPSTASDEVHRFLYGTRGNVSFEQLANPEINIRYGTAYLHILHNRYFSNVKDKQVREACVIASYNLGPNRFLKLYGPNTQQAVNNINSMTPAEFHADLPRRLPVAETRFYVEKVKRMKQHYSSWQ